MQCSNSQMDGPEETLQAALMAVNIPNDEYRLELRARNGSAGAQGNNRHVETAIHPLTEQESKVIGMVLKALNGLKSDMRTVKNILNISDGTKAADTVNPRHKSGWRRHHGAPAKDEKDEEQIRWSNGQGYKGP